MADEDEDTREPNSTLVIRTGSGNANTDNDTQDGSGSGEISYPVNVYVFNENDKCVNVSSIADKNSTLSVELTEGTYNVYAVAGAGTDKYTLPTKDNATTESVISLNSGCTHGDLMTAKSNVVLTEGEKNTLTLGLERQVMMIQSVTVNNVPTDITAVSVTISPLKTGLKLNGGYEGTNGSETIALTKDGTSRTWKSSESVYMLAASGQATIKVSLTKDNVEKKSFSYSTSTELAANHKINITGTYVSTGVTLTGTITGATWGDEVNISFDSTGSTVEPVPDDSDDSDTTIESDAPEVGTVYKGAYVLSSEVSGNNTVVTLMSAKYNDSWSFTEGDDASIKSDVNAKIAKISSSELTGWRLPTLEEIRYAWSMASSINSNIESLNKKDKTLKMDSFFIGSSYYYLYLSDDNVITNYMYSDKEYTDTEILNKSTTTLRAFTTVTFENK